MPQYYNRKDTIQLYVLLEKRNCANLYARANMSFLREKSSPAGG
jgi:hypothetical protein